MSLIERPSVEKSNQSFGGYTNLTNTVSAAAKTEILDNFNKLVALIPDIDVQKGSKEASPTNFDQMSGAANAQLHKEIADLHAAIAAAP